MSARSEVVDAIAAFYSRIPDNLLTIGELRRMCPDLDPDDVDDVVLELEGSFLDVSVTVTEDPNVMADGIVVEREGKKARVIYLVVPLVEVTRAR